MTVALSLINLRSLASCQCTMHSHIVSEFEGTVAAQFAMQASQLAKFLPLIQIAFVRIAEFLSDKHLTIVLRASYLNRKKKKAAS
jgi:hypothetical protein